MILLENSPSNRDEKASAIARDILTLSRNSLHVSFRFLDRALSSLSFQENENLAFATDGEFLYYNPWYVLGLYRDGQSLVPRNLFHSVLHCVFRHNFISREIDRFRWDLAVDVAVESMLTSFSSPIIQARREAAQALTLETLRSELGEPLTAERIYRWLGEKDFSPSELQAQRELFRGDGHGLWYGAADPNAKTDKNINLRRIWEDISKRMQTELETLHTDTENSLVQNLKRLNRARCSYTDFLRHFGIHGETLRLSDEEFDNNYYTYGLDLYGNVPLIEPLEYSDEKLIREFVIAIDTSGSVKGDVVQSFIQHTHDILVRRENFFTRVNMFILQCDDRIQDAVHITTPEDFDAYIRTLEIKGLGRTDFRPVFEYTASLLSSGQLSALQGLIYFTDGLGTFPAEKPPYDVAFILHTDGGEAPPVPDWAQHLAISEEDILDKRFSAY